MVLLTEHAVQVPTVQRVRVQAVFAVLFTTLRRLAQTSSPSFHVCLSILDTISQVRVLHSVDSSIELVRVHATSSLAPACR